MPDSAAIQACLAFGSNIEPRAEHLEAALAALRSTPGVKVLAVSKWHETEPVRSADSGMMAARASADSQGKYLNGACVVATSLSPTELLRVCLDIERSRGRDRAKEGRWGSRTLDLDVLLYGDRVIHESGLTVPHPRMLERLFVLEPLAEVAGNWIVPPTRESVQVHLARLRATDQT